MPQDQIEKLKQEIQSEYLAAFQKTVAMHEVFIIRLTSHPVLREEPNLQVFLEYDKDLTMKTKTTGEALSKFIGNIGKSLGNSFSKHVDTDEYFEGQKAFIVHYNRTISTAADLAVLKVQQRKGLTTSIGKVALSTTHLANTQTAHHNMSEALRKIGSAHEVLLSIEKKLVAKEDLKMSDLLMYYSADGKAAQELMHRRIKAYNAMISANKTAENAQKNGKKVVETQDAATAAKAKYDSMSKTAKDELAVFKKRRKGAFRKGLVQYTQCQIRQSQEKYQLLKATLSSVRDIVAGK